MGTMSNQQIKDMINKEIEKYQNDKSSFKPYFQSMKELTSWLVSRKKL